jgi:protein gp37
MSDKSSVEWTDATWNPVTGCTKLSQGCKNCYAEREWARIAAPRPVPNRYTGRAFTDVAFHPELLGQPSSWRKPRMIFVNSMSDLFHELLTDQQIEAVWAEMLASGHHTFQVLTKRVERALEWLCRIRPSPTPGMLSLDGAPIAYQGGTAKAFPADRWPLPNVWLLASVEDQPTADERVPLLQQAPAAVRGLSCEPMLGAVDLQKACSTRCPNGDCFSDGGRRLVVDSENGGTLAECICSRLNGLHWVIAGGESGPKARPMHPDWARSLRDQCAAAGVPFFFKQWGEWTVVHGESIHPEATRLPGNLCRVETPGEPDHYSAVSVGAGRTRYRIERVGKKLGGRLLDGRTHDGFPETKA